MALRHTVTLQVVDRSGKQATVLRGANMTLPTKLLRWLFGDFTQIYLLAPGQSVESVDIWEIKEGGAAHGND